MMKKLQLFKGLFIIAMFLFVANDSNAQGAYVNLNVGYGFCMSSSTMEGLYNYTSGQNSSTTEQIYFSLGKGLNFGGTFGYMFNEHVGAELGLSYLLGGKTKAKDEYNGGTTDYGLSSNMFRFIPAIVVAAGTEGVNPYAKFGLVIGTGSVTMDYEDNDDGDMEILKMKLNGGAAFGISGALGAIFELADNISLFGELNTINMSHSPTKGEITEATYNGTDVLPDMTTSEKEVEFVDEVTYNYNNPPPDSQPSQELKYKLPFGSLGINVGVVIHL
jgi:hypothetical protein